jgi:hypothetical protein
VRGVCRRVVTHQAQENRFKTKSQKAAALNEFLHSIPERTRGYEADKIFQMDETPIYFDMTKSRTIDFKGLFSSEACSVLKIWSPMTSLLQLSQNMLRRTTVGGGGSN